MLKRDEATKLKDALVEVLGEDFKFSPRPGPTYVLNIGRVGGNKTPLSHTECAKIQEIAFNTIGREIDIMNDIKFADAARAAAAS